MKTIKLLDQLRASREIYERELKRYDQLSDAELARVLAVASGSTLTRALAVASDSTLTRVLDAVSGSTLARALAVASDSTLTRALALASVSTIARALALASDSTIARALAVASDSTLTRVLAVASGSTLTRVLDAASDSAVARVLAVASGSTLTRVLDAASSSTVTRLNANVPIVDDLDHRMLGAVEAGALDMRDWHCGTTHCRAGWAITFGGDDGKKLESLVGPETAGRLIYEASTGRIAPDFYASNEDAIADIRRCAGVEVTP